MKLICVYGLGFCFTLFTQSVFANDKDSPIERVMPLSVGESFCLGQFLPEVLWKENLFDAQIDGRVLTSKLGKKILNTDLLIRAKKLAVDLNYKGFSAGVCKDGSGWIVAFPSAFSLKKDELNKKYLVVGDVGCKGKLSARAVNKNGGVSRELNLSLNQLKFSDLGSETTTFSVECIPFDKTTEAPKELYLVPVSGLLADIPHKEVLNGLNINKSVINWVNAIRKDENLGLVALDMKASGFARELENQEIIGHSIQDLLKVRTIMEIDSLKFIGENRVIARDLMQACKLLWNSPRHRDLLLDKFANKVGVHTKKEGEELFLNFVMVSTKD